MSEPLNCILVTPHGRSGSIFFQSLLDGHPQVISFPGPWFQYSFPGNISNVEKELDEFIRKNPDYFDSVIGSFGPPGSKHTKLFDEEQSQRLYVDIKEFRKNALQIEFDSWIKERKTISRKDFVIGIHKAYAKTIGQNPSEIKYILIHAHHYDGSHDRILNDFPNLFYAAMVRDPRQCWLSLDKMWEFRIGAVDYPKSRIAWRDLSINNYATVIQNLYHFSSKLCPGHLKIIDLHRFHELNREAMISLANCFGIEYLDLLLESTIVGKLWLGNSAERKPINGFSPNQIPYKWSTLLPKEDEFAISSALRESIRMLGYPKGRLNKDLNLRTPFKALVNQFKVRLAGALKDISNRTDYKSSKMHRLPVVLAKTLNILYTTLWLAKSVYDENNQLQYTDLKGRQFDSEVFL
jgi:hypothetical protein